MNIQQRCVSAYRQHRHLKLAAEDVGIPWQTVYVHLRRAGEPVTGNKLAYGSDADKLAGLGERQFLSLVPDAEDMNGRKFQSKVDFYVRGYSVDVKCSTLKLGSKGTDRRRWAFSVKKQEAIADFFVCFGFDADKEIAACLLIPGEISRRMTTINLPESGGKWRDYEVDPGSLRAFFDSLPRKGSHP